MIVIYLTSVDNRGANELTKEDALSYVKTVKQTLHNDGKYEEFLKLMDDCRTSRFDFLNIKLFILLSVVYIYLQSWKLV